MGQCVHCAERARLIDGVCEACLSCAAYREARRSLLWLAVIWLPIIAYVVAVLANDTIQGHWRFASAAPAVLLGSFASAFVYGGLVVGLLARLRCFAALQRLRAQGW
jgi:hypothetical protein